MGVHFSKSLLRWWGGRDSWRKMWLSEKMPDETICDKTLRVSPDHAWKFILWKTCDIYGRDCMITERVWLSSWSYTNPFGGQPHGAKVRTSSAHCSHTSLLLIHFKSLLESKTKDAFIHSRMYECNSYVVHGPRHHSRVWWAQNSAFMLLSPLRQVPAIGRSEQLICDFTFREPIYLLLFLSIWPGTRQEAI